MKQAMLLAAGRGARLAPLTDTVPKPLIRVGGEAPLLRHLRAFAAAGFQRVVINLCHLGEHIADAAGDGSAWGLAIRYSREDSLLGAAGGIRLAMARGLLTAEPFALANADVICDYDFRALPPPPARGCHLLLAPTPPQKARGDFSLQGGRLAVRGGAGGDYTYAGIGAYDPAMFAALPPGEAHELLPLLQQAIADNRAGAALHRSRWHDIGTPESLRAAEEDLLNS